MKRLIVAAKTGVDLTRIKEIGYEVIDELRKIYPDIPAKPRYSRSIAHAAKDVWMLKFDLGINVTLDAIEYQDSIDPDNYQLYWDYIHKFEATCKEITDKYTDDTVQCHVNYIDFGGSGRSRRRPRPRSTHAVLCVYDELTPTR